jgi:hypothetical protein
MFRIPRAYIVSLMPWDMRPVEVDFFDTARYRYVLTEVIRRPAEQVFDAVAADPAGWGTWYPGFTRKGAYLSGPQGQPGAIRRVTMGGITYDETILAWETPSRWAFRVDRSTAPLAHALAEDYRFVADGGTTIVQWTFAVDPRRPLRAAMPLAEPVLGTLWRRATGNLERKLGG